MSATSFTQSVIIPTSAFFAFGLSADTLTSTGARILTGAGAPVISAPQGSIFLRTDGAAGSTIYANDDGATSWAAL